MSCFWCNQCEHAELENKDGELHCANTDCALHYSEEVEGEQE